MFLQRYKSSTVDKLFLGFCFMLAMLIVLFIFCEGGFALAAGTSPFASAASEFKLDFFTVFQGIAGLFIMCVGIACMCGRINKMWLFGCVLGVILIFGADQIVSWIRNAAGV